MFFLGFFVCAGCLFVFGGESWLDPVIEVYIVK